MCRGSLGVYGGNDGSDGAEGEGGAGEHVDNGAVRVGVPPHDVVDVLRQGPEVGQQ